MTRVLLASSSMAAAAGSMPFSAWRKKSGGPEPFSIRSIRVPLTTSDCASRDDATDIPPPKRVLNIRMIFGDHAAGAFQSRCIVLAREMYFAIARGGRSGRLALRGRHERPIDIARRIGRDKRARQEGPQQ